jgi:hypothetical protein
MKAKLIHRGNGDYKLYVNGATYAQSAPNPHRKLSKQNCDEIFGVVDVEKLAKMHHKLQYIEAYNPDIEPYVVADYTAGFNKAMELMKDKLTWFKQPTEIDVVIEMEDDFNQCDGCKSGHDVNDFGMHVYPDSTRAYMVCQKAKYKKPKLDSEGCLVLKRV